ncbi:UNVERIFIED_CONTAM: hypothetical protein Scaly_0780600 [Sesamum calycinum]|uniref:DUF7081 domain-containing protein n=1 Tax=Sesamum calycinum TaxID=2727403 RepID=A0AAW2R951_9LAMI
MLIFLYLLDPLEHANSTGIMDVDVSDSANGGSNWMSKDGSFLRPPVSACVSGYYTHRFLIAPKRLQKSPTRKLWLGSKPSIIRFLQSEFAEADIDTFFASFTWEIPAERRSMRKAKKRPPSRRGTTGAESGGQILRRTRNSARKLTYLTDQDTTTSMNPPLSKRVSADVLSSHTTANENDKACDPDIAVCPVQNPAGWSTRGCTPQDPNSRADHLTEMTTDGFDSYLNSLDEVLSQSVPRAPNSGSALSEMEDFKKAREELSSLIAIDFPSLITSNKLPEVTNLSSKLQSDPHLSPKAFHAESHSGDPFSQQVLPRC